MTGGSFRDPAGYVVCDGNVFKRVVTNRGRDDYRRLMASGLYEELVSDAFLVRHVEQEPDASVGGDAAAVLVPDQLTFTSYPYEWSFSQLKDAALLTLELQCRAQRRGLSLKDASAYNVQFEGCRPVFIDTLSFEADRGGPWVAYEQFCRHFLGPLLLMQYRSGDLGVLLQTALDGFPVPFTSRLLPWHSYARPGALLHVHLHSWLQGRASGRAAPTGAEQSPRARDGLLQSLRSAVEGLRGPVCDSAWLRYRQERAHYSPEALESKERIVRKVFRDVHPTLVYDLGANDGEYSRLMAAWGARTVALERDAACVDAMYRRGKPSSGTQWVLPLVQDCAAPSPGVGAGNEERMSFASRGEADLTLALGLIHHLRIRAGIPLDRVARHLAPFSRHVLVEFVPPGDPMADRLLRGRDYFEDYSDAGLVRAFAHEFRLSAHERIAGSERSLFLFRRLS